MQILDVLKFAESNLSAIRAHEYTVEKILFKYVFWNKA